MSDPFCDYRELEFMESRIPVLDALSTFVPADSQPLPEVQREIDRHAQSRWFPQPGGLRVLVPYDGGTFDAAHFKVEPQAWDHDTCDSCGVRIPAMTLCWVTRSGRYVTLCVDCKTRMDEASEDRRPSTAAPE